MHNPRLAGRYAKSLLDLSQEKNELEAVYGDMRLLQSVCKSNPDFVNFLRSPIIHSDKKETVIKALLSNRVTALTDLFIQLLLRKTRESNLPEIVGAFIDQYNKLKGIHRVKLTTAVPVSEDMKQLFVTKIKNHANIQQVELETKVDERLIGGFKMEMDGNLVDASIQRELNDVKRQFKSNEYIHQIR
ncbi:MAG TPA: ATP synthase F1 subunit delta [Ferruginibacter sp.]|nr:ATP synthase F1 subunit delta [Ferruginibacter sp.]